MDTESILFFLEELGSVFTLLSALVFMKSGFMALDETAAKSEGKKLNPEGPSSTKSALTGSVLGTISTTMLLISGYARLEQRKKQLEAGETQGSLAPNTWIVIGMIFAIIGSLSLLKGAKGRLDEEAQITII